VDETITLRTSLVVHGDFARQNVAKSSKGIVKCLKIRQ
jgi:hypothetical protein